MTHIRSIANFAAKSKTKVPPTFSGVCHSDNRWRINLR